MDRYRLESVATYSIAEDAIQEFTVPKNTARIIITPHATGNINNSTNVMRIAFGGDAGEVANDNGKWIFSRGNLPFDRKDIYTNEETTVYVRAQEKAMKISVEIYLGW